MDNTTMNYKDLTLGIDVLKKYNRLCKRITKLWHKYSEEKPKPLEICLIKNYKYYGALHPEYMLCEYSNLGEESSEPWTELNGESETYSPDYSEYWISISEIEDIIGSLFSEIEDNMELGEKYSCDECGRENDHPNTIFYKKDNKIYCVCCVYDYLTTHKELQELTIEQALKKEGFIRI